MADQTPREFLQDILETALGSDNVFFQPPPNFEMTYPAIVYRLDGIPMEYADNLPYKVSRRYSVTLITKNPEDPAIDALSAIRKTRFDRHYVSPGLHNYVFEIFS